MIISDLNILEVVEETANIQGGTLIPSGSLSRYYTQDDKVTITFTSNNNFHTDVNSPKTYSNSASAGAKGDAINPYGLFVPSYSYTKADTLSVAQLGGGSFSASTSAAVINKVW